MKKKLILLSFLSLFGLTTLTANAQNPQTQVKQQQTCCNKEKCTGEVKKAKKMQKGPKVNPFEGLNLTSEQQSKIDKLKADRKDKRDKDKKAQADARKKEREQFNKDLASILTPEQMAQYKANCEKIAAQKKNKGDRKGHGNRPGGPKGPKAPRGEARSN